MLPLQGGAGSTPGWGIKISQVTWCDAKKKKNLSMILFHIQEVDKQEAITSGNRRLKYIWGLWEWRGGAEGLKVVVFL